MRPDEELLITDRVAELLACGVPGLHEMFDLVDFSRESFDDDRTLVLIRTAGDDRPG